MQGNVPNRWRIAAAGVAMQVALGAVYAWSVFRKPLSDHFDTSVSRVNLIFSLAILALGFAAYFGGRWMGRVGPRRVGMAAGVLYGIGIILASLSSSSILLLYLTYGLLAGVGIGLGYIVPVATLIKWFPDRRGFITGIAVAGFGAGALVTAPIAERLIEGVGLFETFAILGVLYLVVVTGAAATLSNPPEGWKPAGWEPDTTERSDRSGADFDLRGRCGPGSGSRCGRCCSST
jgi:MFS transporter, OFA family, oxalate/formate antiporter